MVLARKNKKIHKFQPREGVFFFGFGGTWNFFNGKLDISLEMVYTIA